MSDSSLNQFSRTELLLGQENMNRLKNSRVAVFGVGGVGGHAVEALARSGVGTLDLIDNDKLELCIINDFPMFEYSEEDDTYAALHYADDVPAEEKTRRLNEIISHQVRSSARRYGSQIGLTHRVLIEGPSHKSASDLCGRASNNMMCVFPDLQPGVDRKGRYADVRVVCSTSATLLCEEI